MANTVLGFNERKGAHIVAALLSHAGAPVSKLKIIKLVYIAEREFLRRYELSLTNDEFFSMQHGPVCSRVLDGLNGKLRESDWTLIGSKGHDHALTFDIDVDDLDELSRAELRVLADVWEEFGHMTAGQLRKWTHEHCAEYVLVEHGRQRIDPRDMIDAIGLDDAAAVEDELRLRRRWSGASAR